MKRRPRLGIFRMLIAFFAGVIVTLFFLVPGKTGPTLLVNGDRQLQIQQLDQASDKIEAFGENILTCAYQAKDYVQNRLNNPKKQP